MSKPGRSLYSSLLVAGLMLVSAVGCGTIEKSNAAADKAETAAAGTTHNDVTPAARAEKMNRDEQIAHAKKHLAEKMKLDPAEITVLSARAVTWRSGAMGCPKPGMRYTQALVPGKLIILNADGHSYRYHSSTDGEPYYCPEERAESPADINADA